MSDAYNVDIGDSINITCLITAYPLPTVTWAHSFNDSGNDMINISNGTRGRIHVVEDFRDDFSVRSILTVR